MLMVRDEATWTSSPSPDCRSAAAATKAGAGESPAPARRCPQSTLEKNSFVRSDCGLSMTSEVSGLDDDACVHEDDLVGNLASEADLVGDNCHRHAGRGQVCHNLEDLTNQLWIERRGRLVEEHNLPDPWLETRNRDALRLPEASAG